MAVITLTREQLYERVYDPLATWAEQLPERGQKPR